MPIIPCPRKFPTAAILFLIAAPVLPGQSASDPDLAFFEKHIRPILAEHCYECHSAKARKLKGGLHLDSKDGWREGGESGPAIIPGEPDQSLLFEAIRYHNPDLEMPPEGKLSVEVVARFEEWIRRGAFDPRQDPGSPIEKSPTIDLQAGRRFWSFRPLTAPTPPVVGTPSWPLDPVDHFILAPLEARNLPPSDDAPPHALLRRLHLDLTGLPPTVDEIERFLSQYARDPRAALETKVDQLLSDPGFGERWGRHWLDLARYADSSGGGRAIPLRDAWRFRDYVIDAFNQDRPLNQLIREHIAGDLLPHQSPHERLRNLVGTGFLVLGPHNYENQDKELLDLEIVDEQIDTIGRAFLGMTISCARCHDHKFDPIPTSDYYALAGIFTSTRSVKHSNVSAWHTEPVPLTPDQQAQKDAVDREVASLNEVLKLRKKELGLLTGTDKKAAARSAIPPSSLPGLVLDNDHAELIGEWRPSTSAPSWVGAGYIHDIHQQKSEKSATFRPDLPTAGRYEVRFSYSASSNRDPKVPVTVRHAEGEQTILIDQRRSPKLAGLFHSLGTFSFKAGTEGFVRISNSGTTGAVIADAVQFLAEGTTPANPAATPPPTESPDLQAQIAKLKKEVAALEQSLKETRARAPASGTIMAVSEGTKPANTRVRIRGMPRNFGAEIPRGVLQVTLPPDAPRQTITSGSGRRELAEWIASADNPLTARVLANRVWLHLFGEGLVRDPDNFGVSGEPPTHPELLDHLAQRLLEADWSVKPLIRSLVLSRSYQLSTTPGPTARTLDPENRLLSHARRRALDAETLRDSLLFLSGQLDRSAGGPSLPPGFKSEFGYKFKTLRRSIYVPVFRNTLFELFATFDFANPNFTVGRRSQSTIPTQSLFLANSGFIHRQAEESARSLLALEADDDSARIRLAFLRTLGRPPGAEELSLSLEFLQQSGNEVAAWAALQRGLFASLDFRYLP